MKDKDQEIQFKMLFEDFYNNILYYNVANAEKNVKKLELKAFYHSK